MPHTVFERCPPQQPTIVSKALAHSVLRPFWLDDVQRLEESPALQGEHACDLAIVGGGFLGLWTAVIAKERHPNRSVILLEGNRLGWAASGRNGGFCEASITHGEANGKERWPEEFDLLERLGLQNLDEIEATLKRYDIDCDFERTGTLVVAVEPYQEEALRGAHYLSAEEARSHVNSPTYLAAVWDETGTAMLHPGKLAMGLARVAYKLGVRIYEHSMVNNLQDQGHQVRLQCAHGFVNAHQVVLATNAYTSLLKRFRYHTIPVYDYVLMTEPLSTQQMESVGWKNRQGVADMANQFHYYRITKDNRILFGGYDAVYHFGGKVDPKYEERPQSYERLASHFFTTFPQLEGLRFTHRWSGAIDTSTRFCAFYAQAMRDKVAYAAGFTGLGVGATRFAANVLLDKLEKLDTERTRLRMVREMPMPFPPEPLAYAAVQSTRWALNKADHNHGKRNLLLRTLDAMGLGFDS